MCNNIACVVSDCNFTLSDLFSEQARAPFYSMTDEQRTQWVQRLTLIQCLPLGRYSEGEEKKDKDDLKVFSDEDEVKGKEKKGDTDRE